MTFLALLYYWCPMISTVQMTLDYTIVSLLGALLKADSVERLLVSCGVGGRGNLQPHSLLRLHPQDVYQRKWKSLRDTYVKEKKREKDRRSGSAAGPIKNGNTLRSCPSSTHLLPREKNPAIWCRGSRKTGPQSTEGKRREQTGEMNNISFQRAVRQRITTMPLLMPLLLSLLMPLQDLVVKAEHQREEKGPETARERRKWRCMNASLRPWQCGDPVLCLLPH
ncbi:hypothetical protein NQZ68_000922 [Dissostichus eleginoides]|nr:hypothetical protein NQZ68_000922 [Dissostichus eleginoides]